MLPYPLRHMPNMAFQFVHSCLAGVLIAEFVVERTIIEIIPVLRVSKMPGPLCFVPPGELHFGNVSAVNAWLECKPG